MSSMVVLWWRSAVTPRERGSLQIKQWWRCKCNFRRSECQDVQDESQGKTKAELHKYQDGVRISIASMSKYLRFASSRRASRDVGRHVINLYGECCSLKYLGGTHHHPSTLPLLHRTYFVVPSHYDAFFTTTAHLTLSIVSLISPWSLVHDGQLSTLDGATDSVLISVRQT